MNHRTPTIHQRFASASAALFAAGTAGSVGTVGDPEGTRTITSIVALLVAIGLALLMVAVWLYRSTRPDPELLAPLEMMGERKWRRADPVWQRRRLDQLRPDGAQPLEPSSAPPDIDEAFDLGPTAPGFDDLAGDALDEPHGDAVLPPDESSPEAPTSGGDRIEVPTPPQLVRPSFEEFPDGDVDPELLATAMAELDAELGRDSDASRD